MTVVSYLELLADDAPTLEFDGPLDAARKAGADHATLEELEHAKALSLRVRHLLEASRHREAELAALYETAGELASRTDVTSVLEAIVQRSRRLLSSDVAYMTLMDDEVGDTYTAITDGGASALFTGVRVSMGDGIAGLVAQTAIPYATASYFEDDNIKHTEAADAAVRDECLVSLVGVPLVLDRRVIGVLFAANRTERPFPASDIALLSSFAAHAAVALDKARLLSDAQEALREVRIADELLRKQAESLERAARAHDRLSGLVLQGGDVEDVARAVSELVGGDVTIADSECTVIVTTSDAACTSAVVAAAQQRVHASTVTEVGDGVCSTPVVAGTDILGTLTLVRSDPLDDADQRIVERAALVTALLLLFRRSLAATEERLRGELLEDIILGRPSHGMSERARRVGADLDVPHAVVVAQIPGERTRLAEAAAYLAGTRRGLSTVHEEQVVVVLPDLDPKDAGRLVSEQLRSSAGQPVTVGAAGPASGVERTRTAYAEAASCMQALLVLGQPGQVAEVTDLGFIGLLLAKEPDAGAFVRSVLGAVLDYDLDHGTALERTLRTYFANAGNINRTARALHLHPKTVSQRLDRVTRLLGPAWNGPEMRLQIQIAVHLRSVLHALDAG